MVAYDIGEVCDFGTEPVREGCVSGERRAAVDARKGQVSAAASLSSE